MLESVHYVNDDFMAALFDDIESYNVNIEEEEKRCGDYKLDTGYKKVFSENMPPLKIKEHDIEEMKSWKPVYRIPKVNKNFLDFSECCRIKYPLVGYDPHNINPFNRYFLPERRILSQSVKYH